MMLTPTIRHASIFLLGILAGSGILFALFWFGYPLLFPRPPLLQPTGSAIPVPEFSSKLPILYGFLPFWQRTAYISPELTHVAYFNWTISKTGDIDTTRGSAARVGWSGWQQDWRGQVWETLTQRGQKKELVLAAFETETIDALISNSVIQQRFIQTLAEVIKTEDISGINLDVEYSGAANPEKRAGFVSFVQKVRTATQQQSKPIHLSVDVYANAAAKPTFWDVKGLEPYVDHIIVMGYDFHRSSSPVAGPVAPLRPANGPENDLSNLTTAFVALLQQAPANKLILAIPLYGYSWQTTEARLFAPTYPGTGRLVMRKDILNTLAGLPSVSYRWDEASRTPFTTRPDLRKNQPVFTVVSYDDERSIQEKMEFASDLQLGGVAFWALGYAEETDPVWSTIHSFAP